LDWAVGWMDQFTTAYKSASVVREGNIMPSLTSVSTMAASNVKETTADCPVV